MYLDQDDEDMIWEDIKWSNLVPGLVVRVWKDEPIPADMVLLKSSNPDNLCYVDTAQLDGETSLKPKDCLRQTTNYELAELVEMQGVVEAENPNKRITQVTSL